MSETLHKAAMLIIILGSVILFALAFIWFSRGNSMMGFGMFVMGAVAMSNYYLHRRMMKKDR